MACRIPPLNLAVLVAAILFAGAPAHADLLDAPFTGAVSLSVGSVAPVIGRAMGIDCTVAGNVSLTLEDGSTITFAVATGFFTVPFAVSEVNNSGTTATASYWNLR